ncbi:hypothetical protein [Halobacillus litoralis]|uniref:hypothetical protein n=1 Tax=Halobacillus litoralis TaxID=45668 RepID=UPI001CFDBEA2|nr:hypothetical protein [Halobacillus litoralis]
MSKFVKGTFILGILVIAFGIWQLVQIEEKADVKVKNTQNITHQNQNYEQVFIAKDNTSVKIQADQEAGDDKKLHAIGQNVKNDDEMKELIAGIGTDVTENLQELKVETEEDWKVIEEDSKKKQQMIDQLQRLTKDEVLQEMAAEADQNLQQMIIDKDLVFYKEAISPFKELSELL